MKIATPTVKVENKSRNNWSAKIEATPQFCICMHTLTIGCYRGMLVLTWTREPNNLSANPYSLQVHLPTLAECRRALHGLPSDFAPFALYLCDIVLNELDRQGIGEE